MNRRRFLSVGTAVVFSPMLGRLFPASTSAEIAWASNSKTGSGDNHETWLKLTPEEALEPEIPICDPHHHLWQEYLLKDLLEDIGGGHNVTKTVFVEAWGRNQDVGPVKRTPVEETAFAVSESTAIASGTEVAAGIVGYADLMDGSDVRPLLEAHLETGGRRFRGIRAASRGRSYHMSDSRYLNGCACLQQLGLSLDVYISHSSFGDVVSLARAFPEMPIIINHIGIPENIGSGDEQAREVFLGWKANVAKLSLYPNIFMKLGGLGMASFGFDWNRSPVPPDSRKLAEKTAPLINYCIETLGAGRCMFESNFPVDRESYSYNVLWNAFKRMTRKYSPAERSALFYQTAAKVYRL